MIRKFLLLFILLFISINAFALEKLTVILDWFPNPNHAPLFTAQQEGYFQKEGLDLTIVNPANPADAPKLVAAGKADIGVSYPAQLSLDQKEGLPLIKIGELVRTPMGCLAVDAKSNIKTLADLKGKTIAYSTPGVDILTLETMLHSVGLSTKDVTVINVNYDLTQALMTHRVDAVVGIMRNFEVIEMEMAHFPVRTFYPENYGMPKHPELIFIANSKDKNAPKIEAFLKALNEGNDYLQKNPESAWSKFAQNHPELNNSLNKKAWFSTLSAFNAPH